MDVPCSNAKACCLVLAEAGVGLRKLLSPIFAAAGSGAHAEDLDTESRCCWMLKDASTCFFNMVHPRNPGCHLEPCSTLVKIWSIRRWPDSCSPWQLCNAGHHLLGSRCACYTAGPLAKKFYNVSLQHLYNVYDERVVAVWQTIFQWHKLWNPKMGSWWFLGHLCLPLGSLFTKVPWKTQLQQRYCHYGNRLLRVLFVAVNKVDPLSWCEFP